QMAEIAGCSRQCLVCTVLITATHLGMDTCRACSSFFKRTKTTGKKYPCRQGDRQCVVLNGKMTCRGCRFDKCVAIGMEYNGPLRERRKAAVPILQRIKEEWRTSVERRLVQELRIIKNHGGYKRCPHPTQELYDAHHETCYEIYEVFIIEAYVFFKNVFPAFAELNEREQELIFKDYIAKMSMVEGYHRTKQIWGGFKRYMMCSILTCHDRESFGSHEQMQACENSSFLISYAQSHIEEQNALFLPMFNKCSITDEEYYALIALVMSELDSACDISEEAQVILDRYRHEVLEDLQLHYQNEMGLRDYSTRLGNLMSLNHAIQECKSNFKIFFRFFSTVFDVFVTDNKIKDFFL
ncbi:hypothetical protein PENTCL1PPCAC_15453, partial [Pristionchus entomophagus]